MIISLTGTPGTGKTKVAEKLKDNFKVINLNDFSKKNNIYEGLDIIRNSEIINIANLDKKLKEILIDKSENIILDSHLSHLLSIVDKIIILRCHPAILKNRLNNKGWNENKINENIQAEILDIILCETIQIHDEKNIFEIDTTKLSSDILADKIRRIINTDFLPNEKYLIGKIDWTNIDNFDYYFKRKL